MNTFISIFHQHTIESSQSCFHLRKDGSRRQGRCLPGRGSLSSYHRRRWTLESPSPPSWSRQEALHAHNHLGEVQPKSGLRWYPLWRRLALLWSVQYGDDCEDELQRRRGLWGRAQPPRHASLQHQPQRTRHRPLGRPYPRNRPTALVCPQCHHPRSRRTRLELLQCRLLVLRCRSA